VVPGVTSGIAAPAYAGIPVTHRGLSSSVTFITGHEDPTKNASAIDWTRLARMAETGGTLCFYMGMRNLGLISGRLVGEGVPRETPVALVRWGTTNAQQVLVATLQDVDERAREAAFGAPAIILVGPVAALRERLAWFEDRPLFGRTVVVTRSRSQASAFSARLTELGAAVLEVPTIEFAEPDDFGPLDAALGRLGDYNWVVFTSVNGVDAFFERLAGCAGAFPDARALAGVRVAAIGPATAERLASHGIRADVLPKEYRGEAVFTAIASASAGFGAGIERARVLIPRAQVAREALPSLLRSAGAHVDVVAAYKTVPPTAQAVDALVAQLKAGKVDAVTFTSSSTARNLVEMLGDHAGLLRGTRLFSIGPVTSKTLADKGFSGVSEAREYTIDGLTEALVEAFA
jgi:uroporphyrinogen III methyltransferase/synthase